MKIRIKFAKQNAMKFIGHLDIMRYFQKAIRRADVDIKYSEGFSPHQIMSFAAPLGVGLTSNGEYMDIEVNSTFDSQTMISRLNEVMVDGMKVLEFRELDEHAGNAMSIVAAADYNLSFRPGYEPEHVQEFLSGIDEFLAQKQIMVMKETKKGEKEVDIRPGIYEMQQQGEDIFMKLSTGSTNNLKPELIMKAYHNFYGIEYKEFTYQVEREEVYADNGTEGNPHFISLAELGDKIE